MAKTLTPQRQKIRRHRIEGDAEDFCFRVAVADLDALDVMARQNDVAIAELVRRAVRLFLGVNMNMVHVHPPIVTGHDPTDPQ